MAPSSRETRYDGEVICNGARRISQRARWRPLAVLLLAPLVVWGQGPRDARYRPVFHNDAVAVYRLELPPGFHAPSLQNQHDVVWVALDAATLTFMDSDQRKKAVRFAAGDVRFFRSFTTESLVNDGEATFRGVLVQLNQRTSSGSCPCDSDVEKTVCGCPGGQDLPDLWALALRNVTLAGTTLAAGQGFARGVPRGDMLLIALTAVDLRDETDAARPPAIIQLQAGEAAWIAAGRHRLRNVGNAAARFVTVELERVTDGAR